MATTTRFLPLILLAGCAAAPEPARGPVAVQGPALVLTAPRQVVLTPVSESGARRLWRGEGGVAVATDGPRVVATAGLGPVLMATRLDGPDPLSDPRALLGREATARRTVDLGAAGGDPNAMRFGLVLECRLGGRMDGAWLLVEERCAVDGRGVVNRFWSDPATGAVRRSEQWAGDAPLVIEAVGS